MEGFYEFDSEEPGMKLPKATELKEIKQMLLTGDRLQILKSVDKLKPFLNSEKSLSEVLKCDICEFLCDAILPQDSLILCALYNCIEMMTSHVEFYSSNHSCFVVESLMRSLHFVMKDSSLTSLNQCLNLLNIVLKGYTTRSMTPEKKTLENLLQLLPALLKNLSPTINNKYQIGNLILSLIELGMLSESPQSSATILNSLSLWFDFIREISESEHSLREKLILLCSSLCYAVLRFLLSTDCQVEVDESLKNEITKNACEFYVNVGAPYCESVSYSDLEAQTSYLEDFYQAILLFYNEVPTPEKHNLVHGLSEQGFFQFTTRIISFADFSQGQKLRGICVLALFLTVLHLSEEVFLLQEVWPTGRDDFRCEVQRGMSQLPIDATQWLDVLVDTEASFSSKLSLLLYLYFYCMTAKSQNMLEAIYPAIVSFIRQTNGIESSILLLKVVWFVLVMCQLSVSSHEIDIEVTSDMVSLLETQEDLSLVYTHHPSLLYWAFSSKATTSIQTPTVYLWLRNKTSDCKELDELMRNSSDVRFAIYDILQNGWGKELDSAFTSLKSLLLDSKSEDILSSVWFLLPEVLAKFTTDSTSVTNVDYMIELCSLQPPEHLDASRFIRIASLLPEVLKSDLISIIPSLSLILHLLDIGQQLKDTRVLYGLLRHDEFILKVIEGLNSNVSDVSILSVKLLRQIWKESKEIKKTKKISLNVTKVLQILQTECHTVLNEALIFLQEILLSNFQSAIFKIENINSNMIEILFYEIQNIHIKGSTQSCWNILTVFFSLPSIGKELVTDPFIHEVILSSLSILKKSKEMKEFLYVWLEMYSEKLNDPCFERRLFGGFFAQTVQRIGRTLVDDFNPEDGELLDKVIQLGFNTETGQPPGMYIFIYCLGRFCLWMKQPLKEFSLTSISPSSNGSWPYRSWWHEGEIQRWIQAIRSVPVFKAQSGLCSQADSNSRNEIS